MSEMAEAQKRVPRVGDTVVFHDPVGLAYQALVTAVWSPVCLNVVYVSQDEAKTDPYGRQIERQTSLLHKSSQPAHGIYWRFEDEEPSPIIAPQER